MVLQSKVAPVCFLLRLGELAHLQDAYAHRARFGHFLLYTQSQSTGDTEVSQVFIHLQVFFYDIDITDMATIASEGPAATRSDWQLVKASLTEFCRSVR